MLKALPAVGTAELLDRLSVHVPDAFILQSLPQHRGVGRKCVFSPAQLWRVHLLSALTHAHSLNAIVRLLPEQRTWRRFARLSHRERTPDVRMLHEFRARAGVGGLRAINDHLVLRLLKSLRPERKSAAVIDATDLRAATADKKKTGGNGLHGGRPWGRVPSSRDTRGSSSVTRSTLCGCGCTVIRRRFS